jgi:hypothetical protein
LAAVDDAPTVFSPMHVPANVYANAPPTYNCVIAASVADVNALRITQSDSAQAL